ncbi:glycoside hydrolase family 3 C-terminal domain-containing protein [Christensenellaceae bacterium OttesenSCG-928-K19]|nr:glycoside hydrolase family 3 C-terminal domain-containing protein [Christensenellaceae bacterium OttesenSCG-928-K19]
MDVEKIVAKLTVEEKARLCSGKSFWRLKRLDEFGVPSIMMTDGPHGVRKQQGEEDNLGIHESVPATCFPCACATACSFDPGLLEEIGIALGEECRQEEISVLLGPGANIKRSPLCGRNFEYFSEDPFLSGRLAAAMIKGIQSQGVGASLKHFAANNQEKWRMTSNSVVDMRALREIYLAGFEYAVKESQPWTVMCSYNLLNGVYASEDAWLLCNVLRHEWGFLGLVVSDWGATDNRVEGVRAGMDLEMPYSGGFNDRKVWEAAETGALNMADLDHNATRVLELIDKAAAQPKGNYRYDVDAHHHLARRAAAQSCVLLKNEGGILPLKEGKSVAVIGAFAKLPRYQGAGSSKINPTRLDNAHLAFLDEYVDVAYAQGYQLYTEEGMEKQEEERIANELVEEACVVARQKDVAVIFAGLPDAYESEGYDRASMDMPVSHVRLIEEVAKANPNTVVVLQLGAPVLLPWRDSVKGIVAAYLSGQAGGSACVDVLLGKVCPGGKLAESWPDAVEDVPCHGYYPGTSKKAEYRESIFVGYRYYDKAKVPVAYPFGHGLSYTSFTYSGLAASTGYLERGQSMQVSVSVANTGGVAGAEVVQLYVGKEDSVLMRPVKELKGFQKVWLQPGESQIVVFTLDVRCFSYYNAVADGWAVEEGAYQIMVGSSSADIRLERKIKVEGDGRETLLGSLRQDAPEYFEELAGKRFSVSRKSFEALYGRRVPEDVDPTQRPFTPNSTINDVKDTFVGKIIYNVIRQHSHKIIEKNSDHIQNMMESMMFDVPIRTLSLYSQGALSPMQVEGIVKMLNGSFFRGLWAVVTGISKETVYFVRKHLAPPRIGAD